MFSLVLLCISSFAIILRRNGELVVLLKVSSWSLVTVCGVLWVGLQCMIVVFHNLIILRCVSE